MSMIPGGTGDGGRFGEWVWDEVRSESGDSVRLPAFRLQVAADRPGPGNVWHQVGNDRLTATAHAAGHVVIYSTDAGWVRLSDADSPRSDFSGGTWRWDDSSGRAVAGVGLSDPIPTWEVGGARWEYEGTDWCVSRRVWAPFGDEPLLRIDVELDATDSRLRAGVFREVWGFRPEPIVLGGLMSHPLPPPDGYSLRERVGWNLAFGAAGASRWLTDRVRRSLARRLALRFASTARSPDVVVLEPVRRPRWLASGRPSPLAAIPRAVFVASLTPTVRARVRSGTDGIRVELAVDLATVPDGRLSFAVGLAEAGAAKYRVARQRTVSRVDTGRAWSRTWRLSLPSEPALERETAWHASQLRSARVHDTCFGSDFIAQGSAYGFVHGLQGAPRDYAIFMGPTCLVDPAGARSMLLTMLRLQRPDGSLDYAHTGAGWRTSGGIHSAPTDLPIALLWAATEYVWSTGDDAVLDETPPWDPGGDPVARCLLRSWRHLRERIGIGPTGLVRVGSGDWNDPISAMAPSRRAFHDRGESVYNSAFAVHAIPRAADLLASRFPGEAEAMRDWVHRLREATDATWNGRWFRRATDGRGGVIGDDRLFLDANAWCLIAGVGDQGQRETLIDAIMSRLVDPSPIGPLCLDRPIAVRGGILAPGWDTNGGTWAALSGLLAWGLSLHRPDSAVECLRKQTFAAHARAYPDQWAGIWSGPDAFNAPYARDPGGTFIQPATPMAEFPVMNANANAGVLLALTRVLGLEPGTDGLRVRRDSPLGSWALSTALGRFEG